MKRIVAVLLLLLLIVSLAACSKDNGTPEDMKNVAMENDKFYLYVPETWVEYRGGATAPNADGSSVLATTYLMEEGHTPESLFEEELLPSIKAAFTDLELIEDLCEETMLGGIDAMQYVYTASMGNQTYWFMDVISIHKGFAYRVTYTSTPEHYADHLDDIEQICREFGYR